MSDKFVTQFQAARRVGTPLMGISTPDPASTIDRLKAKAIANTTPVIVWDVVRGWQPGNEPGKQAMTYALRDKDPMAATANPVECVLWALGMSQEDDVYPGLPEKTVLFMYNAHRYLSDGSAAGAAFVQAIWNLRDPFKGNLRTLVLLGPSVVLPAELGGDVLTLDEPLPSDGDLREIIGFVTESAEVTPGEAIMEKAVDALRGLSAFAAEQSTALAISPGKGAGLDPDVLWERKRRMISATPGLGIWRGGESLNDIGGCEQVKKYIRLVLAGKDAPRAVVFEDEIEKSFAGATGGTSDSSGVTQGLLQQKLVYMQDSGASGMIFVGPPGCAKSAIAKAIGSDGGLPTIAMDVGGMKASLVGESEQRFRQALKVVDAVSGSRPLFVATCNKIANLPPELRRRYTMGTFFFDLPDAVERKAIWKLYRSRFDLPTRDPLPNDEGWTGAEIRQACLLAYRLGIKVATTDQFIVPVSKSAAADIDNLRKQADTRYLSASHPGVFTLNRPKAPEVTGRRAMSREV